MEAIMEKAPTLRYRNPGIDLLRVVAATYVIILHMMGQGGILDCLPECNPDGLFPAYVLHHLSLCAVNLFGIISGYAGYRDDPSPLRWRRYLMLWLEVVFYNVLITLVSQRLVPDYHSGRTLSDCFFPVTKNLHWYFTAYSALFPLTPLLNAGVRGCDRKSLLWLLAVILLLFSPMETFWAPFGFDYGYSFVWVLLLYLIGAILKKTRICERIHPAAALIGIGALSFCSAGLRMYVSPSLLIRKDAFITNLYVFLPNILCSMLHIPLFSRLKPGKRLSRLIHFAAAGSFSVYIINTQAFIWDYYMRGRFIRLTWSSPLGLIARVLATAFVFVAVSVAVDGLRRILFRPLAGR